MKFSRQDDANKQAENLSGTGAVYYSEWIDQNNKLYVKIERIAGGRGLGNGTFSNDLYPVDEIGINNEIVGYDVTSGVQRVTKDKNMSAFLRAIRADIERRRESQSGNNL